MNEPAAWRVASRAVLLTLALVATGALAYLLQNIFVEVFIALIVSCGMAPIVRTLSAPESHPTWRWRPPPGMVVLGVYVVLILLLLSVGSLILSTVAVEVQQLISNLPAYAQAVRDSVRELVDKTPWLQTALQQADLAGQIGSMAGQFMGVFSQALVVVEYLVGIASGALDLFFVLLLALYFTCDSKLIREYAAPFLPPGRHDAFIRITDNIGLRLGGWVRGQLLLCLAIGVTTWIGLLILGVPYSVLLAIIAGVLEAVPTMGPILSTIPIVLVALTQSPFQALLAFGLCLVIQQVENNVYVPRIMARAVSLHPLVVLIALLAGQELMGLAGAMLSVPVAATVAVIVDEIRQARLASLIPALDNPQP